MLTEPLLAYRVSGCTMHHLTDARASPTTTVYRSTDPPHRAAWPRRDGLREPATGEQDGGHRSAQRPAGHRFQTRDPFGHGRVAGEQRGQALTAGRVGDHQMALGDQPV